jgi:hypothetical protein
MVKLVLLEKALEQLAAWRYIETANILLTQ